MKTSNKLLIAFGAFLFLAPLLGMVIVSKMYYKDYNQWDFVDQVKASNQPFETVTKGRKAISYDKPFSTVNFTNGNHSSIEVHVNKSEGYGIKIPEELAGSITTEVINGVLNINFKKELSIPDFRNRIFIVVYAPNLDKLKARNLFNLHCITQTDSLIVNLDESSFTIGSSEETETVTSNKGDTLSKKAYNQTSLKKLTIAAVNSRIDVSQLNLKSLSISAEKNSTITLDGKPLNGVEATINNLEIKTIGQNEVNVKNLKINKAISNFSDSTQLNIPTSILKLLLKD